MKTATQVHEEMQEIFDLLKKGNLEVKTAEALHNNVGKQIGIAKLQIEYAHLRNEDPNIDFFQQRE